MKEKISPTVYDILCRELGILSEAERAAAHVLRRSKREAVAAVVGSAYASNNLLSQCSDESGITIRANGKFQVLLTFNMLQLLSTPLLAQRMAISEHQVDSMTLLALHEIWESNGSSTAQGIAHTLQVSMARLNSTFKHDMGCSMARYYRQYRAELVYALFVLTDIAPASIAQMVNTTNAYLMARAVRTWYPALDFRRERSVVLLKLLGI